MVPQMVLLDQGRQLAGECQKVHHLHLHRYFHLLERQLRLEHQLRLGQV
jgi:hypothetical protein